MPAIGASSLHYGGAPPARRETAADNPAPPPSFTAMGSPRPPSRTWAVAQRSGAGNPDPVCGNKVTPLERGEIGETKDADDRRGRAEAKSGGRSQRSTSSTRLTSPQMLQKLTRLGQAGWPGAGQHGPGRLEEEPATASSTARTSPSNCLPAPADGGQQARHRRHPFPGGAGAQEHRQT